MRRRYRNYQSQNQSRLLSLSVASSLLILVAGLFFQEETAKAFNWLSQCLSWLMARV